MQVVKLRNILVSAIIKMTKVRVFLVLYRAFVIDKELKPVRDSKMDVEIFVSVVICITTLVSSYSLSKQLCNILSLSLSLYICSTL